MMRRDFRFWHLADIGERPTHVRFWGVKRTSGEHGRQERCTNSRSLDLGKACERFEERQSVDCTVPFALFKISVSEAHRIGNMCDAENRSVTFAREGVQSGSLHFDG